MHHTRFINSIQLQRAQMSSTLACSDLRYMPASPAPAASSSLRLWRPVTASCHADGGTFSSSPITWPGHSPTLDSVLIY